jgi:ABC-type phosphate/phosphonate transport system substrate-binding protein
VTSVGGQVSGQVSLPMYPFPELRDAWAETWTAVRDAHPRGRTFHESLLWSDDIHALWNSPDLVLSQSCGWPIVSELDGRVRVVGVFDPDVDGGDAGTYRTLLVARRDAPLHEFSGATAAVNGPDSLSGWVSLVAGVEGAGGTWRGAVRWTGAHVASLAAVRAGDADIASIDPVSFALLATLDARHVDGLHVVGRGPRVPCLPLIVPGDTDDTELAQWREAWARACTDPSLAITRRRLLIKGFVPLDAAAYDPVRALAGGLAGARPA